MTARVDPMIWRKMRKARKHHRCHCGRRIERGDLYWEMVSVDEDWASGWWRLRECGECAERYNRPIQEASQ